MVSKAKYLKVEYLLTRKCQLACEYCEIVKPYSLRGPELTFEQKKIAIKTIKDLGAGMVVFFGGEPTTLGDELIDIIKYCHEIDLYYAIISNGLKVCKEPDYFKKLVGAGVKNWSGSIDTLKMNAIDGGSQAKSNCSFDALRMFRDAGVKDTVCCITVTHKNIEELPEMIEKLTREGIWAITTPLQYGKEGYQYSAKGMQKYQVTDDAAIRRVAGDLYKMAESGSYLMHNMKEYYLLWPRYFKTLDWKCSGKAALTIDADGRLLRCVDVPGDLVKFSVSDLNDPIKRAEYEAMLGNDWKCKSGCFWDPAAESGLRGLLYPENIGQQSFRHEIDISEESLIPRGLSYEDAQVDLRKLLQEKGITTLFDI